MNQRRFLSWLTKPLPVLAPASLLLLVLGFSQGSQAQDEGPESKINYMRSAKFKIPFNVDAHRTDLSEVQLWVSTDEGKNWQMHGSTQPTEKQFSFRAAAEGAYYFSVQTVDNAGNVFPSQNPPLKVFIDTTKPETSVKADVNALGQFVVDIRVVDEHLDSRSAVLRLRTDLDSEWRSIPIEQLEFSGEVFQKRVVINLPECREVGLVLTVSDMAANTGESTFQYRLPRTATGEKSMTLASTGNQPSSAAYGTQQQWLPPRQANPAPNQQAIQQNPQIQNAGPQPRPGQPQDPNTRVPAIAGARDWQVKDQWTPAQAAQNQRPGMLAGNQGLSLEPRQGNFAEELPAPQPNSARFTPHSAQPSGERQYPTSTPQAPGQRLPANNGAQEVAPVADDASDLDAFHCNASSFSLDYSVDALGGSTLSEIELWGTEDGGRTWQKWGTDPDRQSPFDVQVGNDGLFGFRMVIVGSSGIVSNRPKDGDSADVWINVDTILPKAKITRAIYGEGREDGMLVIDYDGTDSHLVSKPITISFSERREGPWNTIASGLSNTGVYLWKPDPNLPENIYLRLEAVDRAGNIGVDSLDVPIATQGLLPRGRIHGVRPVANSAAGQ